MRKKVLILAGVFTAIIVLIIVGARVAYNDQQGIFNYFRSFTVFVDNQSDVDLVSIEAGIIQSDSNADSDSKDMVEEPLASGNKLKFTPKLSLQGEGGIYLKITDSRGETTTHTVCSYTEYLSGKADVTVSNDKVTIDQDCY